MKPERVKCTECERELEFGGMSPGLGMSANEVVLMLARQLGYVKKADGWKCPDHK
jgi:hypothetical protein